MGQQTGDNLLTGAADARLTDSQLAAWLIVENNIQIRVSRVAAERAQRPEVKRLAQQVVTGHTQLVSKLATHLSMPAADGSRPDVNVDQLLDDLAERLDRPSRQIERQAQQDEVPLREPVARRAAEDGQQDAESAETDDARERRVVRPLAERRQRADRADEDGVAQARSELREQRQERREARRESIGQLRDGEDRERIRAMLRDTLPVLRENLPEILQLVSDAAEGAESPAAGRAFIRLQRQSADQFARSVIDEMQRRSDFDTAYINFEVLAHLKRISTLQVAREHASPELASVLEENLTSMQSHLNTARQLIGEGDGATDRR